MKDSKIDNLIYSIAQIIFITLCTVMFSYFIYEYIRDDQLELKDKSTMKMYIESLKHELKNCK